MNNVGTAAVGLLVVVGVVGMVAWQGPQLLAVQYEAPAVRATATDPEPRPEESVEPEPVVDERDVVQHVPLPDPVKAIYMTSCVAGTPSFRERLVRLMQETEINAVMIDVKDYSGTISFPPASAAWQPAWQNARCGTRQMRELIEMLHDNNIFTIARITVFQDPFYAERYPELAVKRANGEDVWYDHKGLAFIDVAATEYWDHVIELAVESYNLGFDEINFDYIRYPSDGPMQDISFPHSEASEYGLDYQANLEAFFTYLHEQMSNPELFAEYRHSNTGKATSTPYTSADLFGMTTTNYDDLSIGQIQERAAPYFDFIAPMVYPSHYPDSFLGLGNPNEHPYKVVHHAMQSGVDRMQATTTRLQGFQHERIGTSTPAIYSKPAYGPDKFRTWIQDFDYGGDYDAADVRAQIQASVDAGVESWMIWDPGNIYTRGALKSSSSTVEAGT